MKQKRSRMVLDEEWSHGGFLFMPDPHGIWQQISDWVAPESERVVPKKHTGFLRRVTSNPSLRGHLFAAGS